MSILERWQELRDLAAKKPGEDELFKAYFDWAGDFTAAAGDSDGLFAGWRLLDPARQREILQRALADKIPAVGGGPQLEIGLLVALYRVLTGRRCFLVTPLFIASPVVRSMERMLSALAGVTVRSAGFMSGGSGLKLNDCLQADVVLVDYYVLGAAFRVKPELLAPPVSLFFLELDMCLYHNRLMFYERGIPQAAGLVFAGTKADYFGEVAADSKASTYDVLANLAKQGYRCGGILSRITPFTAGELAKWGRGALLPKAITPSSPPPYGALTFRTSQERNSALVQDVMKSPHSVLVVGFTENTIKAIQEELRKSGQDCTSSSKSSDIATFFSMVGKDKRVMLFRGMPSTLILSNAECRPGALFIAEHFISSDHHLKIVSAAEKVMTLAQPMRVYFSLQDPLFDLYSQEAGFKRFFDIIDFTERYDPWRQIRRVLAKAMIRKVQRLREFSLHEDSPLITTTLMSPRAVIVPTANKGARHAAKMDAPCFCGSGKPFKECHGMPKASPLPGKS